MSSALATAERPAAASTAAAAAPGRLVSLDAFRGFIMFWIVGGGALVFALQKAGPHPLIDVIAYQLRHTEWQGLRFYDLIWPSFMLMTGMSLPFSYAQRSLTEGHRRILLRVLRRAVVLFLLGSVRESVHLNSPHLVELSSALQPTEDLPDGLTAPRSRNTVT